MPVPQKSGLACALGRDAVCGPRYTPPVFKVTIANMVILNKTDLVKGSDEERSGHLGMCCTEAGVAVVVGCEHHPPRPPPACR